MLDMGSPPEELKRNGNEHRQFIPVNAYRTADGFIYLAIGSDGQFARWTAQPMFAPLAQERFASNEGRRAHKADLTTAIEAITQHHDSAAISEVLARAGIPHAPITPVEQVPDLPFVAATALRCKAPDGREIRLPPPAVMTPHLEKNGGTLPFAPRYGEHTDGLLGEVGLATDELATLHEKGVVAGP